MNSTKSPPDSPSFRRKVKLHPYQYVGFPILLLIPILAVLGFFGENFVQVEDSSDDLTVTIDYATRYRYKMLNSMVVSIQNTTDETIPTLTVTFSRDYISKFSTVAFSPAETRITDTAYEVELSDLAPGTTQIITVDLQGEQYGRHTGSVAVTAEGLTPVVIDVSTFIFP